jgi:hypothetical protein
MGLGALMLLTQFLTLGIVTLTTAGGVLGGYFYRGRKEQKNRFIEQQTAQPIVLEGATKKSKLKSITKL